MKRLIPASILAVVLAVLCIAAYAVTRSGCEKTIQKLNECEQACLDGDTDAAVAAADSFRDSWKETKRLISAFSAHDLLDKISYSAARISGYAQAGHGAAALAECEEIRQYLAQLTHEQKLCVECFY